MATKMKTYLFICFLLVESQLFFGQKIQPSDTLDNWISSFHMISNLTVSRDSRYVAFNKSYKSNNDTLLVFDSQKLDFPTTTLVKLNGVKMFFNDGHLLASQDSRAEYIDLKNNRKEVYENVIRADGLEEVNLYIMLDRNKNLSIYNISGNKINSVPAVYSYITDKKSKLYLTRKNGSQYEVVHWSGNRFITQYSTDKEISRIELVSSGRHLVITEKDNTLHAQNIGTIGAVSNINRLSLTFINTSTGEVLHPRDIPAVTADLITVAAINNGERYLIDFGRKINPSENKMLDIWSGNDKDLRQKKTGKQQHQYWFWKPDTNSTLKLPEEQFSAYAPVNNSRYVIAFNAREEFNYISSTPLYIMYLFDLQNSSSTPIFSNTFRVIASPNGKYLLSFDEMNKLWKIYDIESASTTEIRKGLEAPTFSLDSKFIFFNGENDLWCLDLETKKIKSLNIATGKQVKITNVKTENTYRLLNSSFEINTVDMTKPLLLKVRDKTNNLTSYISWKNGKTKILISPTGNRIKEIRHCEDTKQIFSIEENFSNPSSLYAYNRNIGSKRVLYSSRKNNKAESLMKEEIISYTNSEQTALKGLLKFPLNFDPAKKYPMVVRIYQKQSESAGIYPMPDFDEDGFNARILLERGYFVFLPDIIFAKRGTGLSALDCINSGLDALEGNPNIDKNKIGLTGHSLGGYETNFIATHSDRFAAYVSGSSVSDIVKFYFSFNTRFNIADYSRFETGQFEMGISFLEDKEKYFRNNPIYDVDKVSAPVLLWAGGNDRNVPPDQTMEFYMGLMRNSKSVIVLLYKNKEHDLGKGTNESKDLNIRILEWWDYHLKSKKNVSWIN
jgi:dipeptidyl aminopeptidase/acylaminoacyl peptidase